MRIGGDGCCGFAGFRGPDLFHDAEINDFALIALLVRAMRPQGDGAMTTRLQRGRLVTDPLPPAFSSIRITLRRRAKAVLPFDKSKQLFEKGQGW
jgi:hypothetical protein